MQLKPIFQQIVEKNAQCVIQLNFVVSALRRPCSEHTIVLDSNNDTQIIMKIGVHLMRMTEMLRFMKRKEEVQEYSKVGFPRSGKLRHTMTGDRWTVLRPLMDAIEVPAEPTEYSPRAELHAADSPESSNESQIESQSVCPVNLAPTSPSLNAQLKNLICHGTCASPRFVASPATNSDFNSMLVRMGSIQSEYCESESGATCADPGAGTGAGADSGASADSGAGTATGADSGACTVEAPMNATNEIMPINPCSSNWKRVAQQIAEDINNKRKVFKKPAASVQKSTSTRSRSR